ncbi:hypothetical protein D5R81_15415 [Parashewanella spongiae]|uniref:Uncharacterized protein n=1 Tax=Parashewanella spongiae TaxID=342950 RepID=A0A3A6TJN1_9GAMM|nr:hypothetical protein [Parashewanella spongiae]MCL1079465.1 hypothetical protein [Parashewanella spongiae]RJY07632.1 hypothetical protein D5R81_15415 [Parashewanella spongiae]
MAAVTSVTLQVVTPFSERKPILLTRVSEVKEQLNATINDKIDQFKESVYFSRQLRQAKLLYSQLLEQLDQKQYLSEKDSANLNFLDVTVNILSGLNEDDLNPIIRSLIHHAQNEIEFSALNLEGIFFYANYISVKSSFKLDKLKDYCIQKLEESVQTVTVPLRLALRFTGTPKEISKQEEKVFKATVKQMRAHFCFAQVEQNTIDHINQEEFRLIKDLVFKRGLPCSMIGFMANIFAQKCVDCYEEETGKFNETKQKLPLREINTITGKCSLYSTTVFCAKYEEEEIVNLSKSRLKLELTAQIHFDIADCFAMDSFGTKQQPKVIMSIGAGFNISTLSSLCYFVGSEAGSMPLCLSHLSKVDLMLLPSNTLLPIVEQAMEMTVDVKELREFANNHLLKKPRTAECKNQQLLEIDLLFLTKYNSLINETLESAREAVEYITQVGDPQTRAFWHSRTLTNRSMFLESLYSIDSSGEDSDCEGSVPLPDLVEFAISIFSNKPDELCLYLELLGRFACRNTTKIRDAILQKISSYELAPLFEIAAKLYCSEREKQFNIDSDTASRYKGAMGSLEESPYSYSAESIIALLQLINGLEVTDYRFNGMTSSFIQKVLKTIVEKEKISLQQIIEMLCCFENEKAFAPYKLNIVEELLKIFDTFQEKTTDIEINATDSQVIKEIRLRLRLEQKILPNTFTLH